MPSRDWETSLGLSPYAHATVRRRGCLSSAGCPQISFETSLTIVRPARCRPSICRNHGQALRCSRSPLRGRRLGVRAVVVRRPRAQVRTPYQGCVGRHFRIHLACSPRLTPFFLKEKERFAMPNLSHFLLFLRFVTAWWWRRPAATCWPKPRASWASWPRARPRPLPTAPCRWPPCSAPAASTAAASRTSGPRWRRATRRR